MKTIVFIGCNKSGPSREALNIAKEMGYYTVLYTDRLKFIQQQKEFTDVDLMIFNKYLANKRLLLKEIKLLIEKGNDVKACLSFIDPYVALAAEINNELNSVQISVEALYKMENKIQFRETLKYLSFTPFFYEYTQSKSFEEVINNVQDYFPLVLKPSKSNGSKHVLLINNAADLKRGLRYLQENSALPALIEKYLVGNQFLIEVVVNHEKVSIAAIVEQEISNTKRFIITGYHFPAQLSREELKQLENVIKQIVKELGLKNGTCHIEMRLVDGKWMMIEINPRISGGAMNQIIYHGSGINLVRETIRLYLGEEPMLKKVKQQHVYTKFIVVEKRGVLLKIQGKNKAKKYNGVKEVFVKPRKGSILTPALSMGDRYAYVLATGKSFEEARRCAVEASKNIQFFLRPF